MRYLQASLLLPLYKRSEPKPCRAIPVQFAQLPKFKKLRKKVSPEEWQSYADLIKRHNTSTEFVKQLRYLRNELNLQGFKDKKLLAVVDGSFVNRTCLLSDIANTDIVGRTRKNARFFFRASKKKGRRFYDPQSYTAQELRKNYSVPYTVATAYCAGDYREVRYKEYKEVFWKWGTKRKPLRLITIAPTPYWKTHYSNLNYRDPAYLLTTNFDLPALVLIQKYLDRWQIEVNFKEEKSQMSLGRQQVWSERSIPRAPAFIAASYAALMLAGVLHFHDHRSEEVFGIQPKWRKKDGLRPSFADYMTVLRREMLEKVEFAMDGPRLKFEKSKVISSAAA